MSDGRRRRPPPRASCRSTWRSCRRSSTRFLRLDEHRRAPGPVARPDPGATLKENTMATEIRVPTLGDSVSEATIGRWFKKPGDPVKADEPILELETDKVTLEVNAPAAGTLGDIVAKDGETVAPGAVLGSIVDRDGTAPAAAP